MKKISLPIIALNTLLTMAITVLLTFTYLQCNNLRMPYGMSNNSTVFSISQNLNTAQPIPLDNDRINTITDELKDVAEQTEITIVNNNISNMGLGIFDSRRKYMTPINSAPLFDTLARNNIILRAGSYYSGQESIETLTGKKMSVVGVYDKSYLLFDKEHEFIYDFFADRTLGGTFYIETEDTAAVQKMISIFEKYNYEVTFQNEFNLGFAGTVQYLFSNVLYATTFFGFVFICFNLSLFYFSYFDNFKKRMRLHILYGARFKDLIRSYTGDFILNDFFAVILASLFYVIIFNNAELMLPLPYLSAVIVGAMIFNTFLFLLCIFCKFSLRPKNLL